MIAAELKQATKRYGKVDALKGIDLTLQTGQLLALLGPNGAGKTTAVKLLLGLSQATSGTALVFGRDPLNHETRLETGAMLQVAKVPETLRVREHIDLFSTYYPSPMRFADVIEAAGLKGLENRLFGQLSGGQKQRVLFALALCGNPRLLILDEPTVGLDVEARRTLWDRIRVFIQRGGTVLLTTHYLEEADALADRIVVINEGRIVAQGTPSEIKASSGSKHISCRTSLDAGTIRRLAGVREVRLHEGRVDIVTAESDLTLRQLLAADLQASDFEVHGGGLEEAFLGLTRKSETLEVSK